MPLMMPSPRGQTAGVQSNLAATPGVTNISTTVAAAGSTHTKTASPVTLIASTTVESCALIVQFSNNSLAGGQRNGLFDIMTGAAGSEVVIAGNLANTAGTNVATVASPIQFFLPIRIPAGTRISARHQNSTASQTSQVTVFCIPMGDLPPWPVFSGCEMIGANTSTSSLVAITAGSTGTESGWTSIGSTTTQTYRGVMPVVSTDSVTSMTTNAYHVEWGFSSTTMGERFFAGHSSEVVGTMLPGAFVDYVYVPSGTQLQIQVECGTTADSLQYGLLCFY